MPEQLPKQLDARGLETLHELFEEQVKRAPNSPAVACGDQTLTYGELNERANRLAHHLRSDATAKVSSVAVYLERSVDLVVAILAVFKAGAAYVPIDPDCPRERLAFMLKDAAAAAVLVHPKLVSRLPRDVPSTVVLDDQLFTRAEQPTPNPARSTRASDLAYVIYTSGSTGTPKGVLVEHRSVVGLLRGTNALYQFDSDDVWTMFHSAAFDVSVFEMWGALLHGARLVIVPRSIARSPEDFHRLLVQERVTVLSQTPSAFAQVVRADAELRRTAGALSLRYVIFAGEALDPRTLRPWLDAYGDEHPLLVNMFGITETTVHVTFRRLTAEDASRPGSVIGFPIPGYRVYVLDEARQPTQDGATGEMWVGGIGVARGYLNRPELTSERFVADPFGGGVGGRLYRSGDLARRLPNGDLEYVGRIDNQVKIRGFRVELGEIEAVLGGHEGVAQCVVMARDGERNDKRIVAYWVSRASPSATVAALREHLASALPEYMVPSAFVELRQMPLTANGKLDRQALPPPPNVRPTIGAAYLSPRNERESELASIWSELLGVDRVGVHDDFFELGGHSLLVARVAAEIRSRFRVHLRPSLLFDHPTIAALAALIANSVAVPGDIDVRETAAGANGAAHELPMSFAQQGIWLFEQLTGNRSAYLLSEAWRIRGPLDVEALRRALETIVERHAPLRTRFLTVDGKPAQVVAAPCPFALDTLDLRQSSSSIQEAEVQARAAAEADRPFDLLRGLLIRATLVTISRDSAVLLVSVHHIASDAWSQQILRRELETLYRAYHHGFPHVLNELAIDYGHFTMRQRLELDAHREEQLQCYWSTQLDGLPPLELPTDRPRPAALNDRGAEHTFELPADLAMQLQSLATEHAVTLQMVLLAAYQILLARSSGQVDFGIATMVADRADADCADLIGLFVNPIVLRADLAGNPTLHELLGRVRQTSLGAYDHGDLPFEKLVTDLRPARGGRLGPLAQAMFQLIQFDDVPLRLEGLECRRVVVGAQRVRFELEMTIRRHQTGLRATLAYSTCLFDRERIDQFAQSYRRLLEAMLANPDARVADLEVLTPAQRHQQLVEWSGVTNQMRCDESVHELFAQQARRSPGAIAVTFGDRQLTYEQLNAQADRLASHLRHKGVCRGDIVAVLFDRSIELVVAALAVLKAGAAYLPLDPANPPERSAFMIGDANAKMVLSEATWDSDAAPVSPVAVPSARLAYVMYTSGSTGQPKGVGVPHQAITRLVRNTSYIQFEASDGVALAANPAFDASTFEIWGALLNGGRLVGIDRDTLLSPPLLSNALREQSIDVLFLPTALFNHHAAAAPGMFAPLRYLVVGGEAIGADAVRAVRAADPPRHLLNGYGPTENTTFSTAYEALEIGNEESLVPIGRPISGTTCYVLASGGGLIPVGAPGELYVGGLGLGNGYVNRPELTADRFIPHPFVEGERLFRTGDLARWRADGQLEFLGRLDRQVKLRGHRVELGEIEQVLRAHDAVSQCAVVLQNGAAGKRLVAYWVGHDERISNVDSLRDHLRKRLPEYMLPSAILRVASLPLTVNGKLDVEALPSVADLVDSTPVRRAEPRKALEWSLARVWTALLSVPYPDVHDNFFETGGNSLLAIRMADMIQRTCDRRVSVSDIFANPTIARLATFLESSSNGGSESIIEIRKGASSKAPLYFPPGILGETVEHHPIATVMPLDQPVYSLKDRTDATSAGCSIEEMSARLCDALCRFQPQGGISLAGHSFSGLIAYEMAQQLRDRGRDVELLAILDTGPDRAAPRTIAELFQAFWMFALNVPMWVREDLIRMLDMDMPARLGRSLRKLFRTVLTRFQENPSGVPHDRVEDIFDISGWSPQLRAHVDNNLRAFASYRYRPYAGNLALLRARTRPLFSSQTRDLGWTPLVRRLDIIEVPGNHYTMLKTPHVEILGARFISLLENRARQPKSDCETLIPVRPGAQKQVNEPHSSAI